MSSDLISNMFCSINNAKQICKEKIITKNSKINVEILNLLKHKFIIKDFKISENKKDLIINMLYYRNLPTFEHIKRISKPSLRIYKKYNQLSKVRNGMGFYIVSTSKYGIVSSKFCYYNKVGGEVLGLVY